MLKVLELFAGIGACSKALENLGIEHEIVDAVEIDKYAIKSFNAIHGTNFEPQDIKEWNKDIKCDLIMHGSPCQDFSIAGKQAGGDEGSGTRSSLMYETLRIVEKLKPTYVIWENVKNILSSRHVHNWDAYAEYMEELGYTNHCQILNAKDYGIPQNRERVFTISIKDYYDKDFNCLLARDFQFPAKIKLKKKLKDFLEINVDEKYYLNKEKLDMISNWQCYEKPLNHIKTDEGIMGTITTRSGAECGGMKVIAIKTANKQGYDLASNGDGIDLSYPNSQTRRGRVGHSISKTITTSDFQGVMDNYRVRKLTPRECFRLMGFDDSDFNKASEVCSNAQLYKQAGNSIVVNVLEAILNELLK
ncbi:MAG: DNA cytosine methyltransferase [Erysipelotrichaceae bacterium]|nr:DNA cytosine methyltransferase [Erysipelotrichaceae bacterium]